MLSDCVIVNLPKISDPRGNLTAIEGATIPFEIKRVYYIYDIPAASTRAAHSHKNLTQLLIAISGSFEVSLYDGLNYKTFVLNKPYEGLIIRPMIWRDLFNFSAGAVCLCLASELYDESDYYRNFDDFNKAINSK